MTLISPVRLSQVETQENGSFIIGDNNSSGGAFINIVRGNDGQGGILNLEKLLKFSNGTADSVNTFIFTGETFYHGSIFTTEVFERSIRLSHTGNLVGSQLLYTTQNGVAESELPNIGSAVQTWTTVNKNILPNSYTLELVDGSITYKAKDDGLGNLVDNGSTGGGMLVTGSINYTTGVISITLNNIITPSAGNIEERFITQTDIFSIGNSVDNVIDIKNESVLKLPVRPVSSVSVPSLGMFLFDPLISKLQVYTTLGWQAISFTTGSIGIAVVRDIFDLVSSITGPFVLTQVPIGVTEAQKQAGIQVFVNGVLARPVQDYSYNEIGNEINFVNPLEVGDEVQLIYIMEV